MEKQSPGQLNRIKYKSTKVNNARSNLSLNMDSIQSNKKQHQQDTGDMTFQKGSDPKDKTGTISDNKSDKSNTSKISSISRLAKRNEL